MEPFIVMATIDGALYEVEVKQTASKRHHFEVTQNGKAIGTLNKSNDQWFADPESCLLPDDINAIGKAIDTNLEDKSL